MGAVIGIDGWIRGAGAGCIESTRQPVGTFQASPPGASNAVSACGQFGVTPSRQLQSTSRFEQAEQYPSDKRDSIEGEAHVSRPFKGPADKRTRHELPRRQPAHGQPTSSAGSQPLSPSRERTTSL